MIVRKQEMKTEHVVNMRGGEGSVGLTELFDERIPHLRLLKVVTLEPGSSIGAHTHEAEAEAFYVLEGEAAVLDGGEYVPLYQGDAHLCRDGEGHALANKSAAPAKVLAIIPTIKE